MATLTQEELKVLLMLYASSIDGIMHEEEIDLMLEKSDPVTFGKIKKLFKRMSDVELLACINENKGKYIATEESTQRFLNDIKAVVDADGHNASIEEYFVRAIRKMLE